MSGFVRSGPRERRSPRGSREEGIKVRQGGLCLSAGKVELNQFNEAIITPFLFLCCCYTEFLCCVSIYLMPVL